MLLGLRTITMVLNTIHGQMEIVESRLLRYTTYRERLKTLKNDLNKVIRGLNELLEDLADNGID